MNKYVLFFVGILIYFFIFVRPTYAYLDPGAGSIFIQLIIGTALGASYVIKLHWKKIIKFITSLLNKEHAKKDKTQ